MDNKGTITWHPISELPCTSEYAGWKSGRLLLVCNNYPYRLTKEGYYNFEASSFIDNDVPASRVTPTHWAYINLPE